MNTVLIIYALYAKVMLTLMGIYIYKLRKKVKQYESGPVGYICSTDYAHELSWGEPGVGVGSYVTVFDSLSGVKNKKCVSQCGITKVQLIKLEDVTKSDFSKKDWT